MEKDKKKGFFARLIAKLDKKMEEKAKKGKSCCSGSAENNKDSCCG